MITTRDDRLIADCLEAGSMLFAEHILPPEWVHDTAFGIEAPLPVRVTPREQSETDIAWMNAIEDGWGWDVLATI